MSPAPTSRAASASTANCCRCTSPAWRCSSPPTTARCAARRTSSSTAAGPDPAHRSDVNGPRCIWAAGAELGEGTLWSVREQMLYWVDILGKRLHRCRADGGERASWSFDEEISAVGERAGGSGLI